MGNKERNATEPSITLTLSDRELYALGLWFTDAVAPKGVTEKRTFLTAIDELGLDEWMDKAEPTERCSSCGASKRIGLHEVDATSDKEKTLSSDVVKYLFKELDPDDKATARGNAVRILFRLTERLRALKNAPRAPKFPEIKGADEAPVLAPVES